jgi:hypothetical protein
MITCGSSESGSRQLLYHDSYHGIEFYTFVVMTEFLLIEIVFHP